MFDSRSRGTARAGGAWLLSPQSLFTLFDLTSCNQAHTSCQRVRSPAPHDVLAAEANTWAVPGRVEFVNGWFPSEAPGLNLGREGAANSERSLLELLKLGFRGEAEQEIEHLRGLIADSVMLA
jgi:hypothetical protein